MTREEFYQTKIWRQVRRNVWLRQACLCNRCHKPVYVHGLSEWIPKEKRIKGIVHHKIYLTDINYTNTVIALCEDNLEGLCINCNNTEHFSTLVTRNDLMFDDEGNLIKR